MESPSNMIFWLGKLLNRGLLNSNVEDDFELSQGGDSISLGK